MAQNINPAVLRNIKTNIIEQEILCDPSGHLKDLRYVDINKTAQDSLGRTREQIIGHLRSEIQGELDLRET